MKRNIFAALALSVLGSFPAKADTSLLTAADGWTKITTLPTATDIANNYYVIVDNSQDLMLTISNGSHNKGQWHSLSLWYQTSVSPTTSAILSKLWILQKGNYDDGSYALQNVEYPARLLQTELNKAYLMETNDVSSPNDWSKLNFAYNNGYWTIENGQYPASSSAGYKGYLGPWEETEAITNLPNNRELAGNKLGDFIGRFQIYAISRTKFRENYLAAASSTNPVDVSFIYVSNPTLDLNIDGWTRSATSTGGTAAGNYCTETWHSSTDFKFYQNVTSLPEGAYQVSVQARSQTNSGAVYATVGENTVSTPVNTTTSSGSMQTEATTMLDRTTGKITTPSISLDERQTLTMGFMDEVANHWDVFDNFKLYYLGNDLSVYAAARDAVKTTAENAIASNLVPNACEEAIQTAIDNNSGDYTTKTEYLTAQNAIQTALDTYFTNEIKDAYANFLSFKAIIVGLATGQSSSAELTTFNNAINTATTNAEAATSVAAINTQTANIRSAGLTFISSVEGQFDITFLASQNYGDWKRTDGSAAGIVRDEFLANRPSTIPPFAENFEWTAATTGNVLYQTVSDLPAGYYQVGMYTMALSTSKRDTQITTEATEGDANRSFAFAGNLSDASSIQRTGMPIKFATAVDFADLTTLDVNVHLSSAGNLTFGVQKDANGSNWHFAQIVSIVYSNQPDLTGLKATRDALVSEANGLLAGSDAALLTPAQQQALQSAIDAGNAANDFNALNTVTLTTLPNAINTAKQQIELVKANRVEMIAALWRFENDYNLADGTDYCRVTMSAEAWTALISKVNAATAALDDVSQASSYGTIKDDLIAQMNATDASLRLFKSYKAMVDGTTALSIVGSYGADSNMDTDAAEQTAIAALNTAFVDYATNQTAAFDISAFLGENLDFSAAAGSVINGENSNTIKNITGWEVDYADADTWTVVRTDQSDNAGKLYMRKNWGSAATTLKVFKEKMLPVGRYKLSFAWNSDMANMTNLSCYKLGNSSTPIGKATDGAQTLEYKFEVTGAAQPFDLTFGLQKTDTGNTPAQIVVDDVTLTYDADYVTLDENATTVPNASDYAIVTLNRAFNAGWNALCLPFDAPAFDGAEIAEFDGEEADGNDVTLKFKKVDSFEANKPYFVYFPAAVATGKKFAGVTLQPDEVMVEGDAFIFCGTYIKQDIAAGDYVISGGKLSKASQTISLKGTRTYFTPKSTSGARQIVGFTVDSQEATGIANVLADGAPAALESVYTLSGQKVKGRLKKGIYVVNGKKAVIK